MFFLAYFLGSLVAKKILDDTYFRLLTIIIHACYILFHLLSTYIDLTYIIWLS